MVRINYSFIIPHRNAPILLNRLLKSIPERDDIEIIIVDDNSDNNLRPSTNRIDVQLIFLSEEQSKGAGRARNIGMSKASGKWILFADADDFYENGFIKILDEYVDSDLDILYFNCRAVDSESLQPCDIVKPIYELNLACDGNNKIAEEKLLYRIHNPWVKMLNSAYIKHYKFKFEEINNGNDIQFAYLTSYFAKKIHIDHHIVYIYTINRNGITFKKRSIQFYQCSLENHYKKVGFMNFIGHSEWNTSIFKIFISSMKKGGILTFCNLLLYYISHLHYLSTLKCKYVAIINNIKEQNYVL